MRYAPHPPSPAHARLARCLAPLLALLLVVGELLPVAPATFAAAAQPTLAAPQKLRSASEAVAAAPLDPPSFTSSWLSSEGDNTWDVAWGDYDGDGDLDLAVGNDGQPTRLYRNDAGVLTASAVWSSSESDRTRSVAWGDYDGDGDLDLALGNAGQPNRLYRNDAGVLTSSAVWSSTESNDTTSVAWGDYDGDGDLDLAVGNNAGQNRLYRNDAGVLTSSAVWSSTESGNTQSVAWGDYDGDGDLDLASGDVGPNRLYRNDVGVLSASAVWSSADSDATLSVAWGDVDGDGDLDLAAGNNGGQNRLYRNDNGVLTPSAVWSSAESDYTESVAWGDYDGDGDLDLAAGNDPGQNRLYRNDAGVLTASAVWSSTESDRTRSVAWGDYDGDGDLDLAIGTFAKNRLYRNDAGVLASSAVWSSTESDRTASVGWGDVDGDGDLDLAAGNEGPNRLYRNDAGVLTSSAVWSSAENDQTRSVAWGDVDGDGDLDLTSGNYGQPNRLYRNDAGVLTASAVWSSTESGNTESVAWGDVDGDGDLDLAAGNYGQPIRLYRNDAGVLTASAAWSSTESGNTQSVAWGDYDGDGDLDLAAGNAEQPTRLYRNDAGVLTASAAWSSTESGATQSVAWGDYDGDGDLDLVVSNFVQPTRLYRNDAGVLTASAIWSSTEIGALSVAWGDMDGDGDLDLASGNLGQPARLYRNDAGVLTASAAWSSTESDTTTSVAWGDMDGDGDLDLAAGNYEQPNRLYHNTRHDLRSSHANPIVRMQSPDTTPPLRGAYFYATPHILDQQLITLNYTLVHPDSLTVARVIGQYSLDGGGHWRAAAPINTQTTNLSSSPGGVAHTYTWDTFADGDLDKGVFGQSDNVVFRIIAVPSLNARANQIPGPYLYGAAVSSTLPFRVRGAQPRVLRDGVPLAGALVYRLRPPSPDPTADPRAQLMRDGLGRILRTNQLGYLAGQSPIALNDSLIALQPIGATSNYALYFTSAAPTATGLAANTVVNPGVQALTISSANPLVLLNLSVSLEWDARKENTTFLNRLQSDLQRVSALLYDFTDGQVALGQITIYQNRDHWYDVVDSKGVLVTKGADIRIHASNRLRPNASQGGITSQDRVDPNNAKISYEFGHVRIGTVWNSDGDVVQKEGDDWARALAHELGHYALFLDDNYLGLDSDGRFTSIAGCRGAMSDPYRDDWTEFQPASAEWDTKCQNTLSARLTGRSDWQTIKTFYDNLAPSFVLNAPPSFGTNPGPSALPLAVTQFTLVAPASAAPLESRLVVLSQPGGSPYQPSDSARAFLFSSDGTQIADLGQPTSRASQGQVAVRGARTNDRLCVFDQAAASLGCASLTASIQPLPIAQRPDWQPDVIVTPVTSRTLTLEVLRDGVGQPVPSQLTARLFAADSALLPAAVDLKPAGDTYRGTLNLSAPVLEGYVSVEVPHDTSSPPRAIVTDYALGGNPAPPRRPPRRMRRRAPLTSPDGQVILYSDDLIFNPDEFFFFALQTATRLPEPPSGETIVGQGYRLITSDASRLAKMAINMAYDKSEAQGKQVAIWSYGKDAQAELRWQRLPAPFVNTQNEITAQVQGAGLYVLLARPWAIRLPQVRR